LVKPVAAIVEHNVDGADGVQRPGPEVRIGLAAC
jgi:hypothetical protein